MSDQKDSEERRTILPNDNRPEEEDNSALASYIASEQESVNR